MQIQMYTGVMKIKTRKISQQYVELIFLVNHKIWIMYVGNFPERRSGYIYGKRCSLNYVAISIYTVIQPGKHVLYMYVRNNRWTILYDLCGYKFSSSMYVYLPGVDITQVYRQTLNCVNLISSATPIARAVSI